MGLLLWRPAMLTSRKRHELGRAISISGSENAHLELIIAFLVELILTLTSKLNYISTNDL